MRIYIKATYRAAEAIWFDETGNAEKKLESIIAYNRAIADRVYDYVMQGNYAYMRDGKRMLVYHSSTRGNFIQLSHFCEINGEMVPIRHEDITDSAKLEESMLGGKYINIKAS